MDNKPIFWYDELRYMLVLSQGCFPEKGVFGHSSSKLLFNVKSKLHLF